MPDLGTRQTTKQQILDALGLSVGSNVLTDIDVQHPKNKDFTDITNAFRKWTNADISSIAAIDYSKLNLAGSIVDTDISSLNASLSILKNLGIGSFQVYQDAADSAFKARNCSTGAVFSNSDAATVLQYAITNSNGLGAVFIRGGFYQLSTSLNSASRTVLVADGGETVRLQPTDNFPALIFGTGCHNCEAVGIFFTHAQAGYTSSLVRFTGNTNSSRLRSCSFYDFDTGAGNAVSFENTAAANAGAGIYSNRIINCVFFGFNNTIFMSISNGGTPTNFINGNHFIANQFDNSKRVLTTSCAANSDNYGNYFIGNSAEAIFATGPPFNMDDTGNHPNNAFIGNTIWDIPSSFAMVGVNVNCSPIVMIGNLHSWGKVSGSASITIQEEWDRIKSETLKNKTMFSTDNSFVGLAQDPTVKRWGSWQPINAAAASATNIGALDGALHGHTIVAGGTNSSSQDTTFGLISNYQSAATANVNVGIVSPASAVGFCRTAWAGRIRAILKMDSTTSARLYFGLIGVNTLPISDTPMATAIPGIMVGWSTADTVWTIYQNDAAGAVTKTSITGNIAKDAVFSTIEINWPAGGATINVIFDGVTQTLNSNIPPSTQDLWFNCVGQTSTTTQRTLSLHGVWVAFDK
jgi:hypothetical protein